MGAFCAFLYYTATNFDLGEIQGASDLLDLAALVQSGFVSWEQPENCPSLDH